MAQSPGAVKPRVAQGHGGGARALEGARQGGLAERTWQGAIRRRMLTMGRPSR
jgi:hypothetical protein